MIEEMFEILKALGINGKNMVRFCLASLVFISYTGYNAISSVKDTLLVISQKVDDDHETLQRLENAFLGRKTENTHNSIPLTIQRWSKPL